MNQIDLTVDDIIKLEQLFCEQHLQKMLDKIFIFDVEDETCYSDDFVKFNDIFDDVILRELKTRSESLHVESERNHQS